MYITNNIRLSYMSQNQNQNSNLTNTYVNVVSTNQTAWGGSTYIDFNTPLYCIHDVILLFNL